MIRGGGHNFLDLTDQRFGRLVVVERTSGTRVRWLCRCDCGNDAKISGDKLRSGKTQSCGCLRQEVTCNTGKNNTRHGMKGTPTWRSWTSMMGRHRSTRGNYAKIKVCKRWHVFENFLKDMGEKPTDLHTIDRWPDQSGNYKKSNCRWATRKEQANNRRNNR